MSTTYEQLNAALAEAGVPAHVIKCVKGADLEIDAPVDVLVNTRIDAAPFAKILLDYAPILTVPNEIEMVARCMSQSKGFRDAIPWLLSLFAGYPKNGLNGSHLWAVAQAIYTINEKKSYQDVVSICRDRRYASGRQVLMGVLARARTDDAYEVLVACLDDASVRAHAIEALGRFGRPEAIGLLEPLVVQKGLYEYKAKQTALRRLRRLHTMSGT
jgi:HEAT repeats